MSRKIGVVTVLYNSESVLEEFFETLNKQTYKNFILYVVDNLSPDCSLELSKKLASSHQFKTVIIENDANDGVAKGNNIGIQRALEDGCDLVLLSNNDIALEDDSIDKLLIGLDKNNADMAVPKIYIYGTRKIWAAGGGFIKKSGLTLHFGQEQEDKGQFNIDQKVDYAPTCFMLIKKEVFAEVGLMDENYFVYYDDTDFVYRALNEYSKTLWYVSNSEIYHNESTSTGKMSDFSIKFLWRNLVYFALKNYKPLYAVYVLIYNFLYILIILFFRYPTKQWKIALNAYKEGLNLYINNKPI
ncbi:glycosyltransferase family 2 protein [Chryseobacterium sp. NKUCC03_KSP]|uniref:glycosyltransferase family 2 protein n=1 Tax=Chryseobacterium sp. NKUCC03_KSP TaxID=2842125 RepID=UPI001C5A7F05|nr:glycosyltransferase family 2 protein [Chryseobacterium sp. NKUCC03_KSP]MBW3523434.1 glycosyltransferase family 2 protein [Chryseobacterium sp. NKUCC03_KSP]